MSPLKTVSALADAGLIPAERAGALEPVAARYAVALTDTVARLIDRGDPNDPIARQYIPSEAELRATPEERSDPIGDAAHSPVPGIVHRHADRVLFKLVHNCPVYCRFCFRREMVGPDSESALLPDVFANAVAYIEGHPEIWEVIVTGGDPFSLSARRIGEVAAHLAAIPHVKIVRWHTRLPVVDPARINDEFVASLLTPGVTTIVALHANHPRELTAAARAACARLIDAGIPMLSQSVLLKGVNDDVKTLEALMRTFVEARVKPYYLHHADLAPGTSHFRVSIEEGLTLMGALRARLSGLCVPQYVLDIPGGVAKVRLTSTDVEKTATGWRIRDPDGNWHAYPAGLRPLS
ncbi:MAG: lysine-2,3-aminomutase-like protein [Alphaproteobacteria bacterium]|nr:lysine-2,3-aminomutase-like protein [Alphaproteobacteria bacterium]